MMTRVVSSLVLAPVVLLAVHLGPPASDGLLLAAAGILAWEWGRICGRRRGFGPTEAAVLAATLAAVGVGALFGPSIASAVAVAGAAAAVFVAVRDGHAGVGRLSGGDSALWFGFGVLYLAVPLLALQWLRGPSESLQGQVLLFWLIGLVWATDIGAFFLGRGLKGPLLWPRISPNKTWAGMVGGFLAAGLAGAAFAAGLERAALWPVVLLSLLLSFVAQAGDFFESGIKRQFGIKDASDLIPGHGGLLDRVDGLLAATLALAFVTWLGKAPF